jgi:RNA polymerase sigma factor (sigma-70 family)
MSDAQLVARVRAGDPAGFEALVERHRGAMAALARRVLGPDHASTVDDVVQEALIRAYRALGRDRREIALRPWLLTLVRNCALDELRRVRSFPLPAEQLEARAGRADGPDRVVSRRAQLRQVVQDVATLPDQQRYALLRHAVDGAAHGEIAAELGVSAKASRMLVVRARADLVKIEDARNERCDAVRADLVRAHSGGRRATAHAHRHLLGCAGCRQYRHRLKAVGSALRLLQPGPFLVLGAVAAKLGAGAGTGAAGAAGKAGATGGLAAALSAAAIGGTVLFAAGDPSPLDVRSRALPAAVVRQGEPLPKGTAIVATEMRLVAGAGSARLACPRGHVVADLLPPSGGRADLAYARTTVPGRSTVARVRVRARGASGRAGVAVLCRRPVDGSIIPGGLGAGAASAGAGAVCARSAGLRERPGGPIRASARLGQPVVVLRRSRRWTRVRTDLGQAGWVRASAVCG